MKMEKIGKLPLYILTATSCIAFESSAAIVINEFDYDQPGTDNAEFIELFNNGSTSSLDNFSIQLINGKNSKTYRTINLAGFNINANDYFVVCGDATLVANCDYSFTTTSGWLQNGAPDAITLFDDTVKIDSVAYEGLFSTYNEGDPLTVSDSNLNIMSIARIVDGIDTDNNLLDFQGSCLTPGASNASGINQFSSTGNCVSAVSAVPVPAAMWLFGSGLLGLVGYARKTNKV
jgi:hypothetical protein